MNLLTQYRLPLGRQCQHKVRLTAKIVSKYVVARSRHHPNSFIEVISCSKRNSQMGCRL